MSRKSSSKSSSKKHSAGGGSSSRTKGSGYDDRIPTEPQVSFLFTVNEIEFDQGDWDNYYNLVPPTDPRRYTNEFPSRVMRYRSGEITAVDNYHWIRNTSQGVSVGNVSQQDPETGDWYAAEKYSEAAVMACNPHLPILVCPADPLGTDTNSQWQLLRIFHPREQHLVGVSQVVHEDSEMPPGGHPVRYVAGSEARWMPSLIPTTYKWPLSAHRPPDSRGLGGELCIILGLMALSVESSPGNMNTNRVFLGSESHRPRWRNREWHHTGEPRGYPQSSDHNPRGFLVSVFLDPSDPNSTTEMLKWFEWQQVVVVES